MQILIDQCGDEFFVVIYSADGEIDAISDAMTAAEIGQELGGN